MRPIDADALKERLQNIAYDDWNQGITTSFSDACNEIIEVVEEQPTIEPRKGKWVMKLDPYGFFDEVPVCSECGCTTKMREKYNYCPNCGSRLLEGEYNEN